MKTLHDFTLDQLRELQSAELQIKMLVEQMAYQTNNESLRQTFEMQAKEMEGELTSLDKILGFLGLAQQEPRYSYIVEGIANEVQAFVEKNPADDVKDAGFIALLQKARHYEIALYGTLSEYTSELSNESATRMLNELLEEQKRKDLELSNIARGGVNKRASSQRV